VPIGSCAQQLAAFLNRYRGAGVVVATTTAVATPFCSCGTTLATSCGCGQTANIDDGAAPRAKWAGGGSRIPRSDSDSASHGPGASLAALLGDVMEGTMLQVFRSALKARR